MARLSASASILALAAFLACGGGGGGGTASAPPSTNLDADSNATPAADSSHHKVPSVALGPQFAGGKVTFAYWNPNVSAATLCLYGGSGDSLASPAATVAMTRGAGGVWTTPALDLPSQGFYAYKAGSEYVLDPYGKSMGLWYHTGTTGIPGDSVGKSALVDPSAQAPDGGWSGSYFDGSAMKAADGSPAPYAYGGNRDAIVYEAGIRDLTVDSSLSGFAPGHTWGTYKGLVDLLPHIQKLGVTHVQLLCPLQNFNYDQRRIGTVETSLSQVSGANYNWGYDPQGYFSPSGMYSANPDSGAARVNELKTLINEIHKQGMGVILDVVYNHTANSSVLGASSLMDYFYRSTSRNGAGSRDVRTENKMVRKLVVDSVAYWVREYKVDGFRFDLMGVLDTQTVKAAYAAASAQNPRTLFLGEGWNGFYSGPATDYNGDATTGADQTASATFNGQNIAMFSDSYRDIFKKGGLSEGAAFLSGSGQSAASLFANVAGAPTNGFAPGSTNNVANYLTCHDNLCLYDALAYGLNATRGDAAAETSILKRARIGYAALLTSQGLAFIHAGDEMFRTKEATAAGSTTVASTNGRIFVHNSYNASDAINQVTWSRVYQGGNPLAGGFSNYATTSNGYLLYRYVQGLAALRRSTNAFRLPDANRAANVAALPVSGAPATTLAFGYKAASTDGTGTYYVFHNADSTAKSFDAGTDLSTATLLADGDRAGTTAISVPTGVAVTLNTVTLQPLTSAIFRK